MESIRIKKSEVIEIEVNDNGDKIRINPSDKKFSLSLTNFVRVAKDIMQETTKKNEQLKAKIKTDPEEALLEAVEFEAKGCERLAKAIDDTFGAGSCDKIFGCVPTLDMIADFYTQLTPYIQKAVVQRNSTIGNRYTPKTGGSR